MPSRFINGARYAVSTVLAAPAAISALSNALPAVATVTAAPPADSIVLLSSGWPGLNGIAAKVNPSTGTSMTLAGIDTTDEVRYPDGEGLGAYQVASAFVGLSKVRGLEKAGGEQNFFNYQYVEDEGSQQRQAPTFKSAVSITIQIDYDPDLPWHDAMVELDRLRQTVVLRETLPGGDVILYTGLLSFDPIPTKTLNEFMTVSATFSLSAPPIRYPAA